MGPRMLPWAARLTPTPVAMMRSVPQMKESPMPAKGPMRETLTLLMDSVSNSGSLAFCSSMAAVMPRMSVDMCGVVLKNSR